MPETAVMKEKGWVEVYTAQGLTEAHIIKGLLEFNGIPTALDYEAVGPLLGLTLNGLGEVRVLVPPQWREKAQALIQEGEDREANPEKP